MSFSRRVSFIPLGYLLYALAGDEKPAATAGAGFLKDMGGFFRRPPCPPLSSAKATFQRDLVEVTRILMHV